MKDSETVRYRKASLRDLTELIFMEKKCFPPADMFSQRQIRRFLLNPFKSVIIDLILLGGEGAGYAVYFTRKNSRTIRMYSICIVPEHAGKKAASRYLIMKFAKLRLFSRMVLEVRESNGKAVALYKNLGFTVSKKLKGYYPGGADGLRMTRRLP